MTGIRLLSILALGAAAATACFWRKPPALDPAAPHFAAAAPDSFDVEMQTTKGVITTRIRRHWSPNGADRFYALVRSGFYTDVAFHRTMRNFVAQFGIHGDSAVNAAWSPRSLWLEDDSVRASNKRGTLTFARGGANSRATQLYFNLVDNARLDTANGYGFPPIGEVVRGIEVLDSLNWEYSGTRGGETFPGPSQDSLRRRGNAYLQRHFPRIDYILAARIVKRWGK